MRVSVAAVATPGRLLSAFPSWAPAIGSVETVQGDIGLRVLRDQIAKIKAAGDPDSADRIRILDALIGASSVLEKVGRWK